MLEARNIEKRYASGGKSIEVLRGASLSLGLGQSVSIQGESGSGKTTLLNILAGLESADTGELLWDGESIAGLSLDEMARRRRSYIGIVFQSYYLVPEINALDNVLLGERIAKGSRRKDARLRGAELFEKVGLAGRMESMPATLSGGERQRVAIARAMIAAPKFIFADEPTGNLDERTGDSIIELLIQLCSESKAGLILVTHNAHHARAANLQLRLEKGALSV